MKIRLPFIGQIEIKFKTKQILDLEQLMAAFNKENPTQVKLTGSTGISGSAGAIGVAGMPGTVGHIQTSQFPPNSGYQGATGSFMGSGLSGLSNGFAGGFARGFASYGSQAYAQVQAKYLQNQLSNTLISPGNIVYYKGEKI